MSTTGVNIWGEPKLLNCRMFSRMLQLIAWRLVGLGAGLPTPPKRATAGLPHRLLSAIAVRSGRGRETRAQREDVYSTGMSTPEKPEKVSELESLFSFHCPPIPLPSRSLSQAPCHDLSGLLKVRFTRRTSMTCLPTILVARSVSRPRPLSNRIVPRCSGRKSFICDSPSGRGRVS